MSTQKQLILAHIRRYAGITSMQAYDLYGVTQLAARISELKLDGHSIYTKDIKKRRKIDGKQINFVQYRLKK